MKKIFFALILASMGVLNSEELEKQSGFIVGIEASFGSPISYEGSLELLSTASVIGGLYGGYQYAFDDHFGIKIVAAIHDGTPIIATFHPNIEISAIPFWIGGRVDLLWNFWKTDLHALGMNLAIEYTFETYRSREAKINQVKQSLSSITQHNLYPVLGIYYRYKNNQITLDYRFEGALKPTSKTEMIQNTPINTKYRFIESLNLSWTYLF